MPITDSRLLFTFLEVLKASGYPWAILHQADRLASLTSDLDIVCNQPAVSLLRALRQELNTAGLYPIALWPYEAGGSTDIFFVDWQGTEGIQVDVLYDPEGRGKLGIRSEELLHRRVVEDTFPRLDGLAQSVYLIRKRAVKRQWERVAHLLTDLPFPVDEIERVLDSLGDTSFTAEMRAVLHGERPKIRAGIARWSPQAVRQRVQKPVGAWVHVKGEDQAARSKALSLSKTFQRVLPHGESGHTPNNLLKRFSWWTSAVQPIRLRAGIYVSWGTPLPLPKPDVLLDPEEDSRTVVAALSQRVNSQLAVQ